VAEPEKALTLRAITVGRKEVPADREVWVFGRSDGAADVEFRGERGRVPNDALVALPVKGPGLAALRALDACFGLPDEAFETEHDGGQRLFTILRCRAHGQRFLRDTRGTVGLYDRTTLLDASDSGAPIDIWSKYHFVSDPWLVLQGRTL